MSSYDSDDSHTGLYVGITLVVILIVCSVIGYLIYAGIIPTGPAPTPAVASTAAPTPASTPAAGSTPAVTSSTPTPPPPTSINTNTATVSACTTAGATLVNGACYGPCPTGYVPGSDPTQCVIQTCSDGSTAQNGTCNRATQTVTSSNNITCPSGYTLNNSNGTYQCVTKCPGGMSYDSTLGKCATSCIDGTTVANGGNSCALPGATNGNTVSCPSGYEASFLNTSSNGNAWAWMCVKTCTSLFGPGSWRQDAGTCVDGNGGTHYQSPISSPWQTMSTDVNAANIYGNQDYSSAQFLTRATAPGAIANPMCPANYTYSNGACYQNCPSGYQTYGGVPGICYQTLPNVPLSAQTLTQYTVTQARPTSS